jgi:hypothetical protein
VGKVVEKSVRKSVYIRAEFSALHCYKEAPPDVGFLRHPHRHLFKVVVHFLVKDSNREVEFFQAKRILEEFLHLRYGESNKVYEESCEHIAEVVLHAFVALGWSAFRCEVSEDGENGAILEEA